MGDVSSNSPARTSSALARFGPTLVSRVASRRLWPLPVAGAVAIAAMAVWSSMRLDAALQRQVGSQLEAVHRSCRAGVEVWLAEKERIVVALATSPVATTAAQGMRAEAREGAPVERLAGMSELAALRARFAEAAATLQLRGYWLVDSEGTAIAADRDEELLRQPLSTAESIECLRRAQAGESAVSRPHRPAPGAPIEILAAAPVRGAGAPIVVLLLRLPPDSLYRVLDASRFGESAQTIAFDRAGTRLSPSRLERGPEGGALDEQLVDGLDPARSPIAPIGFALSRGAGTDAVGFRDPRGVLAVGSWSWFDRHHFGLLTQMDRAEAFHLLREQRSVHAVIIAALLGSMLLLALAAAAVTRLQRAVARTAAERTQFGQYTLHSKLGEGGMSSVYRANHALLQRPTALKVLRAARADALTMARFEREVQRTAQLSHPNTIAIYDYGQTPEGDFYYAMELLDGVDLGRLVAEHGAMPPERAIHVLVQVCGSLAEAHAVQLIHRDVKPENVVLTQRGGEHDVVKVLDFGLVKSLEDDEGTLLIGTGVSGTPGYIAPEVLIDRESAGPASDLYAIGAVGYLLLAGVPVFEGKATSTLLHRTVHDDPQPPSVRLGRPVPADLEGLMMACLAKDPQARPSGARALREALWGCAHAHRWSEAQAANWWREHGAGGPANGASSG